MAEEGRTAMSDSLTSDDYAAIAGLDPAIWHLASELHHLVAGFAGRLPDGLVAQLRRWIGAEDLQGVVEAIALSALSLGIAVTPDEARLIATLPAAFERRTDLPEGLIVADAPAVSPYGFTSGPPVERTPDGPRDPRDRAVFNVLYQSPDAVAVRRAVRAATDSEPERRVYLFEADPGTVLWRAAVAAQEALEAVGESEPQVEAYWTGRDRTAYQSAALAVATPLWIRPSFPPHDDSSFGQVVEQPWRRTVKEWFQWAPEVWLDLTSLHRIIQRHAVELAALPLREARLLLANGRLAELVLLLADAAGRNRAGWSDAELDVLRAVPARVDAADLDLSALDGPAEPGAVDGEPSGVRRIGRWPEGSDEDEELADAYLVLRLLLAEQPGIRRVWWSWVEAPDVRPAIPFVLVEVEPGHGAWDVAATVIEVFDEHIGVPSDADAFWTGTELPALQSQALASAELVWSVDDPDAEATGGIRVAETYDTADDDGAPVFASDRARVSDPDERRRLVARLDAGDLVLQCGQWLAPDVLDPERERRVPVDYRSDGEWIWRDSTTYYLEEYGLAPSAPLLEHLRAMERGAS